MNLRRVAVLALALLAALFGSVAQAGPISVGTPITNNADVPIFLTDGTYQPFPVNVTLGVDQFLLPVAISGAAGLQSFQFDVLFDNTVVQELDPGDGTSGIYGGQFTPGDPNSQSFILGGFPLNALGLVDDVAGSYPSLLTGVSGDGVLAYILFGFLPGQSGQDPGFAVANPSTVPEPGSLTLLAAVLIGAAFARRQKGSSAAIGSAKTKLNRRVRRHRT